MFSIKWHNYIVALQHKHPKYQDATATSYSLMPLCIRMRPGTHVFSLTKQELSQRGRTRNEICGACCTEQDLNATIRMKTKRCDFFMRYDKLLGKRMQ